ncbi:cytochrome c biogenesis protein ResB [Georgenia yuyongxinii]|uniref:Cytochrome c biogenesis protein ResB n=1 Tax=Georgenia yuyongxinii TaxID=2589797 RepID=A0A552WPT2_9MICO|nr:cytochrome c biogenesis protein ResB [Georgenia yuyongxinii]TRW44446.1 cytochrome c biogenesis protein ResB [Georgenia yuyongxinii]TRW44765.1 cytochrome c biogenesis protein ResB [Georgenia yuyongxinii]
MVRLRSNEDSDPTNLSSKAGLGDEVVVADRAPATDAPATDAPTTAAPATAAPTTPAPQQPALGPAGWLRWMWRQLTSMRVALMLLLLLAVTALPGSFFPQTPQDPTAVSQYHLDHPALAPWLERLGFFDVYASPWFAAVYLLLFTSLIGCILPRIAVHWRALRAQPPRVPRSFARFPARGDRVVAESPDVARDNVLRALKGRYRTAVTADGITAERGYLRETGNLVFHLSLVGLLVSLAAGQLFSYRGQAVVIEGQSFANSVVAYDSFDPGTLFDPDSLEPFTFTLEEFTSAFTVDAQARDFTAHVSVTEPDGVTRTDTIKVNHPLDAGGANVYLSGNGFAPEVTVRDGAGEVAFSGPVPFLPEDGVYTSRGVIKVPDVTGGQDQLGLTGAFLPTAFVNEDGTAFSMHPQPNAPLLVLTLWAGDLGLDDGVPQNVYVLKTDGMRQVYEPAAAGAPGSAAGGQEPVTLYLEPDDTVELPEGLGSVTFDALPRFAALDLRYDPSLPWLLTFAITSMLGLFASLFVPRRRLWVRLAARSDGGTSLEGAALARGDDPGLGRDLDLVLSAAGTQEHNEHAAPGRVPPSGVAAPGDAHPAADDASPDDAGPAARVETTAGTPPAKEGH